MGDVTPGNLYSIKLVVADETDTALDIAVFLRQVLLILAMLTVDFNGSIGKC